MGFRGFIILIFFSVPNFCANFGTPIFVPIRANFGTRIFSVRNFVPNFSTPIFVPIFMPNFSTPIFVLNFGIIILTW